MEEKLIKELIQLKARYFGSRYFSTKNWLTFSTARLPGDMTHEDIKAWENEKQLYLAESKVSLDGIKSNYEQVIVDRLDTAAALQEKIVELLNEVGTSKDLKDIASTMKTISELQDQAMVILKVDAYRSDLYEKNKTSVENLLKENIV